MRSARALQEAFGLRSTVAVLGFALRTLGQQLDEGKLAELVEQHRSQAPSRGAGGEGGGRGEGRRERPEGRGGGGRLPEGRGTGGRTARVDPFARPPRPEATPEVVEAAVEPPADSHAEADADAEGEGLALAEAVVENEASPADLTETVAVAEEPIAQEPVASEPAAAEPATETPAPAAEAVPAAVGEAAPAAEAAEA
jgi:hypothetical protein